MSKSDVDRIDRQLSVFVLVDVFAGSLLVMLCVGALGFRLHFPWLQHLGYLDILLARLAFGFFSPPGRSHRYLEAILRKLP